MLPVVQALAERGARLDRPLPSGFSALGAAVLSGFEAVGVVLAAAGAALTVGGDTKHGVADLLGACAQKGFLLLLRAVLRRLRAGGVGEEVVGYYYM
jgi:hypothetical protein